MLLQSLLQIIGCCVPMLLALKPLWQLLIRCWAVPSACADGRVLSPHKRSCTCLQLVPSCC